MYGQRETNVKIFHLVGYPKLPRLNFFGDIKIKYIFKNVSFKKFNTSLIVTTNNIVKLGNVISFSTT